MSYKNIHDQNVTKMQNNTASDFYSITRYKCKLKACKIYQKFLDIEMSHFIFRSPAQGYLFAGVLHLHLERRTIQ